MIYHSLFLLLLALGADAPEPTGRAAKPAPAPSRYRYSVKIDAKSLPKGVTVHEIRCLHGPHHVFISNASKVPLLIDQVFIGERLIGGLKLKGRNVYEYFEKGVPTEGKTHLKGWQVSFDDMPIAPLSICTVPTSIDEGRKPGLLRELPPARARHDSGKL